MRTGCHRLKVATTVAPVRWSAQEPRLPLCRRQGSRISIAALRARHSRAELSGSGLAPGGTARALRATKEAEPVDVLVLRDLADEVGTVDAQARNDVVDVVNSEHDASYAQRVRRCASARLTAGGVWNLASSSRLWPSGVRIMAMSARTSLSPTTRSTQRPSTGASPSASKPSSTNNAWAASRSSTAMRMLSIR